MNSHLGKHSTEKTPNLGPAHLLSTVERRVTNRGRNFALENRDRGERGGEGRSENVGHFAARVDGDIFSSAAYLAIWPLSPDLQGGDAVSL